MMMFDEIIRASYSNTSNLRGDALDGNWAFLLPNLELGQVLCIGQPSVETLKTLISLAENVVQVGTLADAAEGFDLIYLANAKTKLDWQALSRLLLPNGYIYYEDRGVSMPSVPHNFALQQSLWLTPTFGNMQTAVPLPDRKTIDYFQGHSLYSPTITQHTFGDVQRRWRKRNVQVQSAEVERSVPASSSGPKGWKKLLRTGLRKARNAAVALAPGLENTTTRNRLIRPLLDRRGILLTNITGTPPHELPAYLKQIALDCGIDLAAYRWGYSARGRYRSQKLLFFLFEPSAAEPVYIVKMVRDTVFNTRLEREHQGLLWLQERRLMPVGTLPQIVFFGYHHNLAIVAETVIAGDAFETRSQLTAVCRYAGAAVDWLIDLSASTVVQHTSANIADEFQTLADRFAEIYRPTPQQKQFLDDQVGRIREQPPPFVFQHGDPGSWNLLVTAENKIAFLDWENATQQGIPIWDLLYFLRSYCVAAGQKTGDYGVLAAFENYFIENSALSPLIIDAFLRYCQQVGLSTRLVEPLFYMCWVFWAVKQAAWVEAVGLGTAHYGQLLKLCIDRRDAPTLARIFSL